MDFLVCKTALIKSTGVMDCMRMQITASEFPELNVVTSGELQSLYPRFHRTFANRFVSLELIILRESVMREIIMMCNKRSV